MLVIVLVKGGSCCLAQRGVAGHLQSLKKAGKCCNDPAHSCGPANPRERRPIRYANP